MSERFYGRITKRVLDLQDSDEMRSIVGNEVVLKVSSSKNGEYIKRYFVAGSQYFFTEAEYNGMVTSGFIDTEDLPSASHSSSSSVANPITASGGGALTTTHTNDALAQRMRDEESIAAAKMKPGDAITDYMRCSSFFEGPAPEWSFEAPSQKKRALMDCFEDFGSKYRSIKNKMTGKVIDRMKGDGN